MAELIVPAMFVSLVVALIAGFPVAFSIAAVAALFAALGVLAGYFPAELLGAMRFRIEGIFRNENLLSLPLFLFMGMLLERTGLAQDMLHALDRLFGAVRGGMAYTSVLVGASVSAVTGFVSASVIAIGLIALPAMLRKGYDPKLATGVVAASGTLAQILPPSIVLIVLADQLEILLLDMYQAVLLPSVVLVSLYLAFVWLMTRFRPDSAPPGSMGPLSAEEFRLALRDAAAAAGLPLGVIFLVLGSVYFGVATPTEAGGIGVAGTLALGVLRRKLGWGNVREAMEVTGILCSGIMFLLFGASFFTLVLRAFHGHEWIESLFGHIPAGEIGFLLFVNAAIFCLAFFLDFFEIAFIVLPLIAPIAVKLGIDMTWFAVLIAVNLQTSFMHPPFGIALYNLRSVAPSSVRTSDIYWGAVPFLAIQILMVGLLIAVPGIVLKNDPAAAAPAVQEPDFPPLEEYDAPAEPGVR
jgi:tripartite ATP-independent transporter DctM subunit